MAQCRMTERRTTDHSQIDQNRNSQKELQCRVMCVLPVRSWFAGRLKKELEISVKEIPWASFADVANTVLYIV